VEVKGEASNPITETSSDPATVAPEKAKDTPLRPATLVDALPLIPGIVRAPDGSVRIAGFGEDHSALLVNSVDVTDPATGGFGLSVPIDSVQTIEVSEMPYLAEYGRFTAGVVAANTRRGGEKWDYSLNEPFPDFFIRSGHLDGVRDAPPRFNLGGPIIANRLYFQNLALRPESEHLEGLQFLHPIRRDRFSHPDPDRELPFRSTHASIRRAGLFQSATRHPQRGFPREHLDADRPPRNRRRPLAEHHFEQSGEQRHNAPGHRRHGAQPNRKLRQLFQPGTAPRQSLRMD
jgi:hypothetical protein